MISLHLHVGGDTSFLINILINAEKPVTQSPIMSEAQLMSADRGMLGDLALGLVSQALDSPPTTP